MSRRWVGRVGERMGVLAICEGAIIENVLKGKSYLLGILL